MDLSSDALLGFRDPDLRYDSHSGAHGFSSGVCVHGGYARRRLLPGLGWILCRARRRRYRKPVRANGGEQNPDGRIPRRTCVHDRVLYRVLRCAIDDTLHRPTKVDREPRRVLLPGAYSAVDCVPDANSGGRRKDPGRQSEQLSVLIVIFLMTSSFGSATHEFSTQSKSHDVSTKSSKTLLTRRDSWIAC